MITSRELLDLAAKALTSWESPDTREIALRLLDAAVNIRHLESKEIMAQSPTSAMENEMKAALAKRYLDAFGKMMESYETAPTPTPTPTTTTTTTTPTPTPTDDRLESLSKQIDTKLNFMKKKYLDEPFPLIENDTTRAILSKRYKELMEKMMEGYEPIEERLDGTKMYKPVYNYKGNDPAGKAEEELRHDSEKWAKEYLTTPTDNSPSIEHEQKQMRGERIENSLANSMYKWKYSPTIENIIKEASKVMDSNLSADDVRRGIEWLRYKKLIPPETLQKMDGLRPRKRVRTK